MRKESELPQMQQKPEELEESVTTGFQYEAADAKGQEQSVIAVQNRWRPDVAGLSCSKEDKHKEKFSLAGQ